MPSLERRAKIDHLPSARFYDVLIIGAQLAGAMAAALLQKRGYRVLLVEHDGLGHGYEHGGYLLPYAPFISPQLKAMPVVGDAFTELGLYTDIQRTFVQHEPDLQLVMKNHRVDLHTDEARRTTELTREFRDDAARLAAQLHSATTQHERTDPFFLETKHLPPDGFLEKWRLKGQTKRHPSLLTPPDFDEGSPPLRLLQALVPFLTYQAEPKGVLSKTRPLSQALKAANCYPGGREGLRELIVRKLIDLGGDYLGGELGEHAIVEHVSLERRRVELKVLGSENVYRGAFLVVATDAGAFRRLIQGKRKHRRLGEMLDLVTTKKFLFTLNWVVKEQGLPLGMGDLLLLETEGELGPLLVQVNGARKPGHKTDEPGVQTVSAAAFVPSTARERGESHLREIAERIGAELDRLMPFARQHVVLTSSPYLDASGVRGSRLLPHPLYEFDAPSTLGVTGLNQRTPVKNLFFASREVLPGLGLEGEFLAGVRVSRLVQDLLKKRDPLKR